MRARYPLRAILRLGRASILSRPCPIGGPMVCRYMASTADTLVSLNRKQGPLSTERNFRPLPIEERMLVLGQKVNAEILYITHDGAAVSIGNGKARGLITPEELYLYQDTHSVSLRKGSEVVGYVSRHLPSEFAPSPNIEIVTILLRPLVKERIQNTMNRILDSLEASQDGYIPLGDKSSPKSIAWVFPGMSKADFKRGLGGLLTLDVAFPDGNMTYLIRKHQGLVVEKLKNKTRKRNSAIM